MQAPWMRSRTCWAILSATTVLLAARTSPSRGDQDAAAPAPAAKPAALPAADAPAADAKEPAAKSADAQADAKDEAATKPADAPAADAKADADANPKPARRGISGLRFQGDQPADDGADAKDDKQPANPLGNLIRNIFRPAARPPERILPAADVPGQQKEGEGPVNGDATARDRIDALAPHDPEQAKRIRRAAEFMAEARKGGPGENWKRAVEVLQFILDRPEDSVIRQANGQLVSVRVEANRLLTELPPEHMRNYRDVHGGEASRLLREAVQSSDVAKLIQVATRFFHTDSGYAAANQLGSIHYDRGEFGMATYWYRQLLAAKAPLTLDRKWQLKAAYAYHQAGDPQQSQELVTQVASAGGPLDLGVGRVEPEKWIAGLDPLAGTRVPELAEWPLFMGTPQRLGKAVGGEPLLLPRWSHPLTYSQPVGEQVANLLEDLTDAGRATVPAFPPILVDGKIASRTLRGVQVVDAGTGRVLWETDEGLSPEKLLSGQVQQQPYYNQWGGMQMVGGDIAYQGGATDHAVLTSLLFRDATWGLIASDGRQLFVLEDHAVLLGNPNEQNFGWWNPSTIVDPYRRDRSSNRLVSYDLATGRPRWAVGGAMMDEPFDLRLAGYCFYGVPVADGNELFIVGEKDSEIRLFSLDPDTGRPNWSQLVAYADQKIDKDLARRWFNAQVSVSGGVVICPTTVGWLVAVDRLNHSVLWAQRYSQVKNEPQQQHPNVSMVQVQALNQQWAAAAPVIVGSRVLYTPPEEQVIECVNLYDGRRLWQEPKGSYLYLAGVFDERAVFVGTDSVAALKLEDATKSWTLAIPQNDGRP
ncbi:MAG TPA: PQQ-binding-like beta-propeller repeat protein, partial [Planctomycetaceae bacterium]|nr:PQQ-binding-like beta-propeller repeat protein [Planctomycetaceae bacterium]